MKLTVKIERQMVDIAHFSLPAGNVRRLMDPIPHLATLGQLHILIIHADIGPSWDHHSFFDESLKMIVLKLFFRKFNLRDILADLCLQNDIEHLNDISRHLSRFAINILLQSGPGQLVDFFHANLYIAWFLLRSTLGSNNHCSVFVVNTDRLVVAELIEILMSDGQLRSIKGN